MVGVTTAAFGFVVGTVLGRRVAAESLVNAKRLAESIISDAQKNVENFKREAEIQAKDQMLKMKLEFEEKTRDTRENLKERELSLINKESNLARKVDLLAKNEAVIEDRERTLERKQQHLDQKLAEVSRLTAEQNVRLERMAGMSKDEAKEELLRNL